MTNSTEETCWDSEDDYFNCYFTVRNVEYEVVIRSFEKTYSIQLEELKHNTILLEKTFDSYDDLYESIMLNCPVTILKDVPSEAQLQFAESQWKEYGDDKEDTIEDYEICTECYDPDCIKETGGCN